MRVKIIKTVCMIVVVAVISTLVPLNLAHATDTSLSAYLANQNYNNLVSDSDFLDINSMSVSGIQNFLASKGSYLANAPSDQLGAGANGRNASQIIYDAAHAADSASSGDAYGISINPSTGTISPKAIIITLQKEQSLITTSEYSAGRLNAAMGYGCPDGGGCNPNYAGFTNQVGWGAWQLRLNVEYYSKLDKSVYNQGNVVSIGDRDGTRSVYMATHSTAALYRYTPHTYYGNYNFWKMGIEWFGFGGGTSATPELNDTSEVSSKMYAGNFKVSGVKKSTSRVIYNGQEIAGTGPTSWSYTFDPAVGNINYTFQYVNSDGSTENKIVTIEKRKNGDISGDNKVDLLDLSSLSNSWGVNVQDGDWTNLNPESDRTIDLLDLSIFANSWGT